MDKVRATQIREAAEHLVEIMEKHNPDIWRIFLYVHILDKALSNYVTRSPVLSGSPVEVPLLKEARLLQADFGVGLSPIELHRCLLESHKIADERSLAENHFKLVR